MKNLKRRKMKVDSILETIEIGVPAILILCAVAYFADKYFNKDDK